MDYNVLFQKVLKSNKPALIFSDKNISLSYAQLRDHSLEAACWMKREGIKKGDPVMFWSGNIPEFPVILAACMRIGAVFVPVSDYESMEGIQEIYQECKAKLLIYDSENKYIRNQYHKVGIIGTLTAVNLAECAKKESLRMPFQRSFLTVEQLTCELSEEDMLVLMYTSGSTGQKKGICISVCGIEGKNNLNYKTARILRFITLFYPIRLYNLFPWYHISGCGFLAYILHGGGFTEITMEKFNARRVIGDLKKYAPNAWSGTATMLYRCCICSTDKSMVFPSIILTSGEAVQPHVIQELKNRIGTCLLFSTYGTTELGKVSSVTYQFHTPPPLLRLALSIMAKVGTFSKPVQASELMLSDTGTILGWISKNADVIIYDMENDKALEDGQIGEICAYTSSFMKGYLGEAPTVNCLTYEGRVYFCTGDVGYKQGNMLCIAGRKKNLIIRSGENIVPSEIEKQVLSFPGVSDAVACGIPSREYGEEVCLCLEASRDDIDLEKLDEKLRTSIPKYMYPKHILFWDAFPVGNTGKLNILKIREEAIRRTQQAESYVPASELD